MDNNHFCIALSYTNLSDLLYLITMSQNINNLFKLEKLDFHKTLAIIKR